MEVPECRYAGGSVKVPVAGSHLAFEDAGDHELKGLLEVRCLYRVVA